MNQTPFEYFKSICQTLPEISEQTGYPVFYLARYFALYYLKYRVQMDEFRTLRLYEYSPRMVDRYLLWRRCVKGSDQLNAAATAENIADIEDKHRFNQIFSDFVHRDWLYLTEADISQVEKFVSSHPVFLVKACTSTQGKNIFRFHRDEIQPEELLQRFHSGKYLLEELIVQHPVLQAVNPDSVNTVRLIAAKKDGNVAFIGAGLRCGGAGQFVDNFHHDGAAYPIDLESGYVTGPGINLNGDPILRHPTTDAVMPGLRIPHWDQVKEKAMAATLLAENIGYIGWDIAITEDSVEFVEGNLNYPGNNIIQIDGPGAWERLKQLMKND